jgi:hypothetical protein
MDPVDVLIAVTSVSTERRVASVARPVVFVSIPCTAVKTLSKVASVDAPVGKDTVPEMLLMFQVPD